MRQTRFICAIALCCFAIVLMVCTASAGELTVTKTTSETRLQLDDGPPFHSTARAVRNARVIAIEGSETLLAIWEEIDDRAEVVPMYAIFLDGKAPDRITETNYTIRMRYQPFDPLAGGPEVGDKVRAGPDNRLFIVQFHVQPLSAFDAPLAGNGAEFLRFMPHNAVIARIDSKDVERVRTLSFVRAVVPYHPVYRVEERVLNELLIAPEHMPIRRYSAQLVNNAPQTIADSERALKDIGVELVRVFAPTARIELRATGLQLLEFLRNANVLFVDSPGDVGTDMDRARDYGGADHVEDAGFTGGEPPPGSSPAEGVRGEVMDLGLFTSHVAFQHPAPPIVRGDNTNQTYPHGTRVYGIVFGDGTGDPCLPGEPCGRGLLPDAQGIFAVQTGFDQDPPDPDRYIHTSQLVRSTDCAGDPFCPYEAVFQTNSWGHSHRLEYT